MDHWDAIDKYKPLKENRFRTDNDGIAEKSITEPTAVGSVSQSLLLLEVTQRVVQRR